MSVSNAHVVLVYQLAIAAFMLVAIVKDLPRYWSSGEAIPVVTRGPDNMAFIFAAYGAIVFFTTQLLETVPERRGLFTVLDIGVVTYLCFFNLWVRDMLLRLRRRLRREHPHE